MDYQACKLIETYRAARQNVGGKLFWRLDYGEISCLAARPAGACMECSCRESCKLIVAGTRVEKNTRFLMFNSEHG